jgi:hypothetical protein
MPDLTDWFFCEVKDLTDILGEKQEQKFEESLGQARAITTRST